MQGPEAQVMVGANQCNISTGVTEPVLAHCWNTCARRRAGVSVLVLNAVYDGLYQGPVLSQQLLLLDRQPLRCEVLANLELAHLPSCQPTGPARTLVGSNLHDGHISSGWRLNITQGL